MSKIFLTGATGYVGGDVLYTLSHSKLAPIEITCLVRDAAKAQKLQSAYPSVRTVLADLDDTDVVRREAQAADIVLHLASTSHVASAKAIAEGLQSRPIPSHWIQISGATLYATEEIGNKRFGFKTDAVHDDVKDRSQILSLIRNNTKRVVENTLLSQPPEVKTALIVGPLIYGPGRGPFNQRSVQAPEIARATLQLGHGFKLNDGENVWSNIHVQDLSNLIIALVTAAIDGKGGFWNEDGVYNPEGGEMTFEELGTLIAKEAHAQNLIATSDLQTIDAEKADGLSSHASILWGTNARTKSSKARQELGWKPSQASLRDTITALVKSEAGSL